MRALSGAVGRRKEVYGSGLRAVLFLNRQLTTFRATSLLALESENRKIASSLTPSMFPFFKSESGDVLTPSPLSCAAI
jgi:hypothetical protein